MPPPIDAYADARNSMVDGQIMRRGIHDARVLAAFRSVPRQRFVPADRLEQAYEDHPVAIGRGQTVSQPYIVALMLTELRLTGAECVLEIGTGSGYQTALLSRLCATVYTVERLPDLMASARAVLNNLGCANVEYLTADGTLGWPDEAPYDAIVVSAGSPEVPEALKAQLAEGGRLILPVGGLGSQALTIIERDGDRFHERFVCSCVFVKLIGEQGWGTADA